MNNLTQISKNAIEFKWKQKSFRFMAMATVLVLFAHGIIIMNLVSRDLTPDPHELLGLYFFVFWPLKLISFYLILFFS